MLESARRVALAAALAFAVCSLSAVPATAATEGSLDTSFGQGGFSLASYGSWAAAAAVAVQPDGRIVTAGETLVGGVYAIIATRLTTAGQPDPSFGNGGIVTVPIGSVAFVDSGAGLAPQPDGKIVMAGTGTVGGKLTFVAVRLTQDGSLDSGFGRGGIAAVPIGQNAIANAVVIDPKGRIALGGTARVGGTNHFAVARLRSNGSIDTRFGRHGSTVLSPGAAWGMVLDSTGGLVLAGQERFNNTNVYLAARVKPRGVPDRQFGERGIVRLPIGATAIAFAIARTPSGKFVISGDATDNAGARIVPTVQLNPDGALDRSFGHGGIALLDGGQGVNAMIIDSSGRILLAGTGAAIVRLNPNGSPDTTFGTGGNVVHTYGNNSAANGIAIQPDGMLVLGGATFANGALRVLAFRVSAANGRPASVLSSVAQKGNTLEVTYVLAHRPAHIRVKLFSFSGNKPRKLIAAASRRNVRAGTHTLVLRLPAIYRRGLKRGRRERLLLRLTIITALTKESAVAVT